MNEEEFLAWVLKQNVKAEWADGKVVLMSPANVEHTELRRWLDYVLSTYVRRRKLGRVLDDMLVRLAAQRRLRVPDLFFVAESRLAIIGRTMLREPPDLIVEVVSPDSGARDWREKYLEYESFGVREYWVIDPLAQAIEAYSLTSTGKYERMTILEEKLASRVVPGFWLKTDWLWPATRPDEDQAMGELLAQ